MSFAYVCFELDYGFFNLLFRLFVLLQPLRWRCAECAVHHERNVREEQHHIYVARTSIIE